MTDAAIGRARPRVGLLGNPGDLYGGTVLAATIDSFETVVDISRTTFYAPPAFLSEAAVLYLAAAPHVTGEVLKVDSGQHLLGFGNAPLSAPKKS